MSVTGFFLDYSQSIDPPAPVAVHISRWITMVLWCVDWVGWLLKLLLPMSLYIIRPPRIEGKTITNYLTNIIWIICHQKYSKWMFFCVLLVKREPNTDVHGDPLSSMQASGKDLRRLPLPADGDVAALEGPLRVLYFYLEYPYIRSARFQISARLRWCYIEDGHMRVFRSSPSILC
jgi:hypothetical protein